MGNAYKRIPVDILPGTHSADFADSTSLSSARCLETDKVYFKRIDGQTYIYPIYGWDEVVGEGGVTQDVLDFDPITDILGTPRSISWHKVGGAYWAIIGTSRKLYAMEANEGTAAACYDITPLQTSSDNINSKLNTTSGSSLLTISFTDHGLQVNDYVDIDSASTIGGLDAADINKMHAVSTVPNANSFTVDIGYNATSTVSNGGGSATMYRQVIQGSELEYPRIWSYDNFGDVLVLTPGDGNAIYEWDGQTDTLPTAVTNAPTANWVFVSNNAVVALGAGGVENKIQACSIGDRTQWTAGPASTAWSDTVEGAARLISRWPVRGTNLIFSRYEVLRLQYTGQATGLWDYEWLTDAEGIRGAKAVTSLDDIAYWTGRTGRRYSFDGSSVRPLPNDTLYVHAQWVDDLGTYARPVPELRQVWFCGFSGDAYFIYDVDEQHHTRGTWDMSAAENPARGLCEDGQLITASNKIWRHDRREGANFVASFQTSYRSLNEGNARAELRELMIDTERESIGGTWSLSVHYSDFMTAASGTSPTTYSPLSDGRFMLDNTCRYWSYAISVDMTSGGTADWVIGKIVESIQQGPPV